MARHSPVIHAQQTEHPEESKPTHVDLEVIDHDPDQEASPHVHFKTYAVVFTMSLIYVAQLVNLVGSGSLRSTIASVVGDAQDSIWIVACTIIMIPCMGPPIAQAADYWGRKWIVFVTTFFGMIGCIILARATTMNMAIAGEAISSISCGSLPLLHAIASEVMTHRNRGAAQAALNFGCGMGGILGLLLGGVMTKNNPEGFRNFWYMNTGLFAVATLCVFCFYNPPPRPTQSLPLSEKLRRLDWVGYALLTIGLTLWTVGLEKAENPWPWKSARTLVPVILGGSFLVALGIYEWKFRKDGMFHHDLFAKDRNFAIALCGICVEGLVFFTANAFLSYQVAVMYDTNTIRVSLHYCIAFIVYMITCWGLAWYSFSQRRIRLPIIIAFGCFAAYEICMATTQLGSARAVWGYPVFLGCGLGIGMAALVTAAQLSAPPELIAITSGLLMAVRAFGGTIGLAVYTPLFHSKLRNNIATKITAAMLPFHLSESTLQVMVHDYATGATSAVHKIPGITSDILAVATRAYRGAFVDSLRGVYIAAACFATAAAVASCFLVDPIKDFNDHIDAPVEKEEDMYGKN